MTTQEQYLPTEHPNAPETRSTSSYLVDGIAMAIYVVAIAGLAAFLDVPYPWLVAALVACVNLAVLNVRTRT